eukprot:TRINITY_DN78795_c0_g1_i1.p1 TRINITY_DN78795_c0_g1~~TRINITY_DN78795_c0_g1_i1.p1  ORF type:complete len:433 (-),score=120.85 TRINITY_DN78795_c0_g1_i1:157-1455(-)
MEKIDLLVEEYSKLLAKIARAQGKLSESNKPKLDTLSTKCERMQKSFTNIQATLQSKSLSLKEVQMFDNLDVKAYDLQETIVLMDKALETFVREIEKFHLPFGTNAAKTGAQNNFEITANNLESRFADWKKDLDQILEEIKVSRAENARGIREKDKSLSRSSSMGEPSLSLAEEKQQQPNSSGLAMLKSMEKTLGSVPQSEPGSDPVARKFGALIAEKTVIGHVAEIRMLIRPFFRDALTDWCEYYHQLKMKEIGNPAAGNALAGSRLLEVKSPEIKVPDPVVTLMVDIESEIRSRIAAISVHMKQVRTALGNFPDREVGGIMDQAESVNGELDQVMGKLEELRKDNAILKTADYSREAKQLKAFIPKINGLASDMQLHVHSALVETNCKIVSTISSIALGNEPMIKALLEQMAIVDGIDSHLNKVIRMQLV